MLGIARAVVISPLSETTEVPLAINDPANDVPDDGTAILVDVLANDDLKGLPLLELEIVSEVGGVDATWTGTQLEIVAL